MTTLIRLSAPAVGPRRCRRRRPCRSIRCCSLPACRRRTTRSSTPSARRCVRLAPDCAAISKPSASMACPGSGAAPRASPGATLLGRDAQRAEVRRADPSDHFGSPDSLLLVEGRLMSEAPPDVVGHTGFGLAGPSMGCARLARQAARPVHGIRGGRSTEPVGPTGWKLAATRVPRIHGSRPYSRTRRTSSPCWSCRACTTRSTTNTSRMNDVQRSLYPPPCSRRAETSQVRHGPCSSSDTSGTESAMSG